MVWERACMNDRCKLKGQVFIEDVDREKEGLSVCCAYFVAVMIIDDMAARKRGNACQGFLFFYLS